MLESNAGTQMSLVRENRHTNAGQISILIILSLIPMLTLFAFVVNLGMLVHAKISLQNAADLAAYSGAATQARQLTQISHINYQMRQVYKKFLFKYYVMGNLSLKCFPRPGGPANLPPECSAVPPRNGKMDWRNVDRSNHIGDFPGMPIVCISLHATSNVCQLAEEVPIAQKPSCVPFTAACSILTNYTDIAAKIQKASCSASSVLNIEMLIQWLYATEYNASLKSDEALQGLIDNIGLIPEEILLHHRIKTVQSYVNEPGKTVTVKSVQALENATDKGLTERSILAFKTAFENLNQSVFNAESIEMKELLPSGRKLLELMPITTEFETAAAYMDGDAANTTGCKMDTSIVKAAPVMGVYKVPDSYVYYAIKLTAKARLLFNPFPFGHPADSIELVAYAAAAPFGSRIGPKLQPQHFYDTAPRAKSGGTTQPRNYPSLVINDNGDRWDKFELLSDYRNIMQGGANNSINTGAVGSKELLEGLRAATLPDEFEIGKYNIPVDVEADASQGGMVRYYSKGNSDYTLWAPVAPPERQGEFIDALKNELQNVGGMAYSSGAGGPIRNARAEMAHELENKVPGILAELKNRQQMNVLHIPDPFSTIFYGTNPPKPIYGKVPANARGKEMAASSFSTLHDPFYYEHGRDGYSVKFIPFQMLMSSTGIASNSPSTPWMPLKENFPEKGDMQKLQH